MANKGKFIDKSPMIHDAGKSSLAEETIGTSLKEYPLQDQVTAFKHEGNLWQEDSFEPSRPLPPIQNPAFCGTKTQVREVINPPVSTRYQEFIQNIKETPYESFWNKELSKLWYYVLGLLAGTIAELVTLGSPPIKSTTAKELINPAKTPHEVLRDSQVPHEWYKKTHNDYNSLERIDRGYNARFNPNDRYGGKSCYDPRGIWVRCACEWHNNEPVQYASKIQADFVEPAKPKLGKVLAP